jgi:hypothetical protein
VTALLTLTAPRRDGAGAVGYQVDLRALPWVEWGTWPEVVGEWARLMWTVVGGASDLAEARWSVLDHLLPRDWAAPEWHGTGWIGTAVEQWSVVDFP